MHAHARAHTQVILMGTVFLAMPLAIIQAFFEIRWDEKLISLTNRDKAIALV